MTDTEGARSGAATLWSDAATAEGWVAGDNLETMLALPRGIVASLVARDGAPVRRVLDVASGPGGFLEAMLDRFPEAEGIWFDVSETMRQHAEARLARFAPRVRYVEGDMARLESSDLPGDLDLVVSSRASHHLLVDELAGFYAGAARLMRPGAWIANLDHVWSEPRWEARLKASRDDFRPPVRSGTSHPHPNPRPKLEDHLAGLEAAGITDVATPWGAFYSVLVVGRKDEAS